MKLTPEQHHEDCDYRLSRAAVVSYVLFGTPVEEYAHEVFACNLGCEDEVPDLLTAARAICEHLWDADGQVYDDLRAAVDVATT